MNIVCYWWWVTGVSSLVLSRWPVFSDWSTLLSSSVHTWTHCTHCTLYTLIVTPASQETPPSSYLVSDHRSRMWNKFQQLELSGSYVEDVVVGSLLESVAVAACSALVCVRVHKKLSLLHRRDLSGFNWRWNISATSSCSCDDRDNADEDCNDENELCNDDDDDDNDNVGRHSDLRCWEFWAILKCNLISTIANYPWSFCVLDYIWLQSVWMNVILK